MTPAEMALFAWTAINTALGVWVLFNGQFEVFGSGIVTVLPLAAGLASAGFLLWRLLRPTRSILLWGAVFWALQIVSVRFPDAAYAFRLGLALNFRVSDSPACVVEINLFAVAATIVFAVVAGERPNARSAVETS